MERGSIPPLPRAACIGYTTVDLRFLCDLQWHVLKKRKMEYGDWGMVVKQSLHPVD